MRDVLDVWSKSMRVNARTAYEDSNKGVQMERREERHSTDNGNCRLEFREALEATL